MMMSNLASSNVKYDSILVKPRPPSTFAIDNDIAHDALVSKVTIDQQTFQPNAYKVSRPKLIRILIQNRISCQNRRPACPSWHFESLV